MNNASSFSLFKSVGVKYVKIFVQNLNMGCGKSLVKNLNNVMRTNWKFLLLPLFSIKW